MTFLVFPVGIAAAVALGLGYVLQQRVAATAPLSEMMTVELLAGLALQLANVGLVEPLLSTNLLFALVFANLWCRRRICWQEVSGAVLLSAALGVFIAVGNPHDVPSPEPSLLTIVLAVASVLGVVGVLVAIARTRVLGDALSFSIAGLAVEAACLAAMVAGVALIGRSPGLAGHHLVRQGAPDLVAAADA